MKKRFLCLVLCLLMIVPVCLMAGCASDDEEASGDGETGSIVDKASEATVTLTMHMITERHVPTPDEIAGLKAEYGEASKEYREAVNVAEAYAAVASELNKITKSKFKAQLLVSFYTEEEYVKVEELMQLNKEEEVMKAESVKLYKKFEREQKAMGETDKALIYEMFYEKYPEYAKYTTAAVPEETVVTEEETIVNEYGITELKYPEAKANQVDIVCVCGYENYIRYINNEWLSKLNDELTSSSKAILSYVNAIYMTAAGLPGGASPAYYAIPNNTTIGEYTYLLLDRALFTKYQYTTDAQMSLTTPNVYEFLEDIANYEQGVVPITGELDAMNVHYWGLDYKYVAQENLTKFASGKFYYVKTDDGSYEKVVSAVTENTSYYTVNAKTAVVSGAFEAGKTYYTKDASGNYIAASSYEEGKLYYTIDENDRYAEAANIKSFSASENYFMKKADGTYYPIYTYKEGTTYYTAEVSFAPDTFSVLGTVFPKNATLKDVMYISNILSRTNYTDQLVNIKKIKDNGYYDESALTDPDKKFAAAVVKGGAELEAEYLDNYFMIKLENPRAYVDDVCEYMIGVSANTVSLSRSMKIVTYLTTNSDFRNLLQYGILDSNYSLSYEKIDGVEYPKITRLNNYYMMDLYKTGNTFIAYPEENMRPDIWAYGKIQNREAKYYPLFNFPVNERDSLELETIDAVKAISEEYKAKIDACGNADELKTVLAQLSAELAADPVISKEINAGADGTDEDSYNANGIYHIYYKWCVDMKYITIEEN